MDQENDDHDSDSSEEDIIVNIKHEYPNAVVSVVKCNDLTKPSSIDKGIDGNFQNVNQCETLNFKVLDGTLKYIDTNLSISECVVGPFQPPTNFDDETDCDVEPEKDNEVMDDPDWIPQTSSPNENLSESDDANGIVGPDTLPEKTQIQMILV